jgi:hypothetical protein
LRLNHITSRLVETFLFGTPALTMSYRSHRRRPTRRPPFFRITDPVLAVAALLGQVGIAAARAATPPVVNAQLDPA